MKNHLTQKLSGFFKFSYFLALSFICIMGFTSIIKKGESINRKPLQLVELKMSSDVTVLLTKPGNFNWTFVLEDAEGNVVDISNNINETATLKGLKAGIYTVWELNPYGCGRVYSFQVSSTASKVQRACISDDKSQFDMIIQTTFVDDK